MDLENAAGKADLTNKQIEALYLYYIKELEQSEIAMKFNIGRRSVGNRIDSAVVRIAKQL